MSKMAKLCEKLNPCKLLQDFFEEAGFIFNGDLDSIVCRECGFKTRGSLSISHIQFMHKLFNSECKMVCYIYDKYNNYALYSILLHIDDIMNAKKCISETEEIMKLTFCCWPKRLPRVDNLVSAGFLYTGVDDDVMCIDCKVILHDWQDTDDPWFEHAKASPNCLLVKLHRVIKDGFIE